MQKFTLNNIYWACGKVNKKHYLFVPFVFNPNKDKILLLEDCKIIKVKVNSFETIKQKYDYKKLSLYTTNFLLYKFLSKNYNKNYSFLYNNDKTINEESFDYYLKNKVLTEKNINNFKNMFEIMYKNNLEEFNSLEL